MTAITRLFALLLFSLFVLIGLSLAGSWQIRYRLDPHDGTTLAGANAPDRPTIAGESQNRLAKIQQLRTWTTGAQVAALLLATILCILGLRLRHRAAREGRCREEAERALERERRALEKRIEDRTRELREEVEERRRAEELNRGQKQVLEMLASPEDQPTEEVLRQLTATVAAQRRFWECALHLVDAENRTLRLAASTGISDKLKPHLLSIGVDFPDAPESCACVFGDNRIMDKMTKMRRPWNELLVANGILSACAVPFRTDASGEVAGTLTVYSRLQYTPTGRDIELLEIAANLAALVIEHRRIHAELVRNAYQDPLTALPNRRAGELALTNAVETARKNSEPLAVLWIDLDRFKRINDQHGHAAGDQVLRAVSERLRTRAAGACQAARMGGDEFLVLLPGHDADARAVDLAHQINALIAEPIPIGSGDVSVSASIGISLYPRDGSTVGLLERNADTAMYRAKEEGSGTCMYSPEMSSEAKERIEIEQALQDGLEQGLFRLVYQPVYGRDRRPVEFEALLRFQHPRLGNIPPSRFIPVAEQARLIEPIGEWVLRESVRQISAWERAGAPPVRMAVNISALQFQREGFAGAVIAILDEFGLAPDRLVLELTESAVMKDYQAVVRQMDRLRQRGVRFAIDDFGTGQSSLSYLHKLPIDVLKIDRSFVERVSDQDGTRPIVEAITAMARHLGISTIAEGVETKEQERILREAGCAEFQGYLFARPLAAEDAERLLKVESINLTAALIA